MPTSRGSRRGGALLTVLWLSAALSAIAFSLANTVRGEVERASTDVDGLRTYYLASGAVERAILYVLWGMQSSVRTRFYYPGAPMLDLSFPAGEARVEVIPEASKLNINTAPPEDLFRLLVNLGVEPGRAREIAMAIVDWRTALPPGAVGPFDMAYQSTVPSFRARHASFEEIEELLLVRGMTPDLFYGGYERVPQAQDAPMRLVPRLGLSDCVSVFGSMGQFDVNTTPAAVLAAVGLPPDLVAALVERRRIAPFTDYQQLAAYLGGGGPVMTRLRVGGNMMFTLRATGRLRLANGQLSDLRRSAGALVRFVPPNAGEPYHILRWYDTAWTQ